MVADNTNKNLINADNPGGLGTAKSANWSRHLSWIDTPANIDKLIRLLVIVSAVLFVLDFFVSRHTNTPGEGFPGYFAFVGFLAFSALVMGAKQLRKILHRNEQYYAPNSVDAESHPDSDLDGDVHQ